LIDSEIELIKAQEELKEILMIDNEGQFSTVLFIDNTVGILKINKQKYDKKKIMDAKYTLNFP
jgi:hypothetical protein